jgi:hypothetical protein
VSQIKQIKQTFITAKLWKDGEELIDDELIEIFMKLGNCKGLPEGTNAMVKKLVKKIEEEILDVENLAATTDP